MLTQAEALAIARLLAADIREPTEGEAVARLLERIAKAEPEVREALVELGALALLRENWTDQKENDHVDTAQA